MSDFALDPLTGDLAISAGKLAIVTGRDAVAQRLSVRLKLFRGDWFLNQLDGIPYHDLILPKRVSAGVRREVFRRAIAELRGVSQVLALDLQIDPKTRVLTVTGTAQLTDLTLLPFVVNPPLFDFGATSSEGEGSA